MLSLRLSRQIVRSQAWLLPFIVIVRGNSQNATMIVTIPSSPGSIQQAMLMLKKTTYAF